MFRAGLQSYLKIVTTRIQWSTLQQHKEVAMCEEGMIIVEASSALLVPHNIIIRNFGFCNYRLQLKFSCMRRMRHMQLQICAFA